MHAQGLSVSCAAANSSSPFLLSSLPPQTQYFLPVGLTQHLFSQCTCNFRLFVIQPFTEAPRKKESVERGSIWSKSFLCGICNSNLSLITCSSQGALPAGWAGGDVSLSLLCKLSGFRLLGAGGNVTFPSSSRKDMASSPRLVPPAR